MSQHPTRKARRAPSESNEDRRDVTAPRLPFEALVEVGAGRTGGFEAESVDVSLDGMRMRTAYLPREGERLVCRFDGVGGEIVCEGEVAWLSDEGRGGEFGVRFTNLDDRAFALLEDLCELPEEAEEAPPPEPSVRAALPGSRVRLHIQGLGSPMRARVRETAKGEVLIGSNLEFLKVGRGVELEEVEKGKKRMALIEHVGVEVDPETNVPQLVVALSYGIEPRDEQQVVSAHADPVDQELTTAPIRVRRAAAAAAERRVEKTPEPQVIHQGDEPEQELTPSFGRASLSLSPVGARVAQVPPDPAVQAADPADLELAPSTRKAGEVEEAPFDDEEPEESVPPLPMSPTVRDRAAAIAGKLAPHLRSAGEGARGALGRIFDTVQEKRQARQEKKAAEKAKAPKRKTAPPPSGALRSDGRRLVRDAQAQATEAEEAEVPEALPTSDKKRTAFSVALGALAVLAIYFASSHFLGKDGSPDKDPAVAAADEAPTDAPPAAALEPPPAPAGADAASEVATAEVPLFGATPLSTTEPVPVPPEPGAEAEGADDEGQEGSEEGGDSGAPAGPTYANLVKEWGVGEVVEPNVLRLKLDGPIEGLTGQETATGFTITVPGRKSISSAAGFKRKDKRLDSVKVVNFPDRLEVSMLFKKDVPAFVARAKGKRLVIELATKEKKASDKSDKPKKKTKKKKK